jgi:maleate isomerase
LQALHGRCDTKRVLQGLLTPSSNTALEQFDEATILEASRLVADARVDVIAWNGTSSGWLGFEADVALCRRIEQETGVRCCTSVLALNEIMEKAGRQCFGLVTPCLDNVHSAIVASCARSGFDCVAERHLGHSVNFSFSEVEPEQIRQMARALAKARSQCLTTFCTNRRAAQLEPALEADLGIPVSDTVSTAVWKALRLCGIDTRRVLVSGSSFREEIA